MILIKMYQIQAYINKVLKNTQEIEEVDDEFNAKELLFSEWNKQFEMIKI